MPKKALMAAACGLTLLSGLVATQAGAGDLHSHNGRGYAWQLGRYYGGYGIGIFTVSPAYVVGSGCRWLRHRASLTGDPFWWRRYHRCVDG